MAGQRSGSIGIFEDGVNANDQLGGTETIKPIQNSVAEVKVLTTAVPAEYGHSGGGVISVVKKSGTNDFHGMASWYGRTRMMQHRLFFDKFKTSQPSPGRPDGVPTFFMMPDANVSGPVYIPKVYDGRNKTFFFFGYQRLHEKKVAQVSATTPTLAMRAGDFNFPGVASNPIYDPATTRRLANGDWARDPFPGNMVPSSRIDPWHARFLNSIHGSSRISLPPSMRPGLWAISLRTNSPRSSLTITTLELITSSAPISGSMAAIQRIVERSAPHQHPCGSPGVRPPARELEPELQPKYISREYLGVEPYHGQ